MDDEERLVFPNDVYNRVKVSNSTPVKDKLFLIFFLGVLVNIVLFIFIPTALANLFGSIIPGVLLVLALDVVCIYFALLKFVFKTNDMRKDLKKDSSEEFTRFFKVAKDVKEYREVPGYGTVPLFQYSSGEYMSCIKLRYGINSDRNTRNSELILTDLFNLISKEGCNFKTVTMTERYKDSEECDEFIASLSNPNNLELSKVMVEIASDIIEDNTHTSNTDCLYILISTRSNQQLFRLEAILNQVMDIVYQLPSAFRELTFLTEKQFIEASAQYYAMEAIDMSMIRAVAPSAEVMLDKNKIMNVCRIVYDDGTTKVRDKLNEKYFSKDSNTI